MHFEEVESLVSSEDLQVTVFGSVSFTFRSSVDFKSFSGHVNFKIFCVLYINNFTVL